MNTEILLFVLITAVLIVFAFIARPYVNSVNRFFDRLEYSARYQMVVLGVMILGYFVISFIVDNVDSIPNWQY